MIMFLANLYCKLPLYESFKACTYSAAKALRIDDKYGVVKKGYVADLLIWDIEDFSEIPYMFDDDRFVGIVKNGNMLN